jgi:cytochrome c556
MKLHLHTTAIITVLAASLALADEETNPIKDAMKFAHKAPKGEKKLSEKIIDGTAPEADIEKALSLYKAMADTKPPKGDQADFKAKVAKLIAATEEVVAKKPDAAAHYKEAVNCKDCHSAHKSDPPKP